MHLPNSWPACPNVIPAAPASCSTRPACRVRIGIGDLGPAAHAWVDALARSKQTWWQMLPVGPTGFGDSPYQSFSTFAGN